MMTSNDTVLVGTYRKSKMYSNGYCVSVKLKGKWRYFYAGGDFNNQVARTMKEIDDVKDGKIK